ncbi:MAG TPA: hypothetical protein VKQ28_16805 [Candidatus Acidoferrum sp.]|nr:hypothetical protein [Candidatus Acidoferrum sp.]
MAKTKSVGGKEYPASAFAYVGNADDPSTWHLPIPDKAHVEDALARFNQTELPAAAKAKVARKLLAAAKRYGIDASGFASEHAKAKEAADYAESYEDIQQELDEALREDFGLDASTGYRRFCLVETFPDYVIARGPDGELYQIDYTDDGDDITWGEPQQVETAYVPVRQSARFLAVESSANGDGWSWPVQIMQSGWAHGSVNGKEVPHYFPASVVAQVAEAANGQRFRRRHPNESEGTGADLPDLTAGWTSECRMAGNAAVGKVNLLKTETVMREKFLAAKQADKLDLFGVSIFAFFGFKPGMQDGKKALIATQLAKYVGLDLCAEAGAGGKILPYAASQTVSGEIAQMQRSAVKKKISPPSTSQQGGENGDPKGARPKQGANMREAILKVLEALRKVDAAGAEELQTEFGGLPEDKHFEFFAKVSGAAASKIEASLVRNPAEARSASAMLSDANQAALDSRNGELVAAAQEAVKGAKKVQFVALLERKISESKLPVGAASLVREHFEGITADEAAVDKFITTTRNVFASHSPIGRTVGTVEVGRNSRDKIQLAVDAMFGVKEAQKDPNCKPFRGIKEAYIVATGDNELRFDKGGFYRVSEAVLTTDFPNLLLNSMTKRLLQDYAELSIADGLSVLYTKSTLGDYKSQDRVRQGYLTDLSTVAEGAAYVELTKPTDEKISYTISKKGNVVTISEETIRNDDLQKIAGYPNRIARAARHTLATQISNVFITPPNYDPDGLAWFHATHNNLNTVALSSAELDARKVQLYKQTEKDSGNRLGLRLWGIMIPPDLEPTARQINNNMTGTNNWYQQFGEKGERILVNPLLVDVTDWYYYSDPTIAPFLEVGFLDGYDTPQLYLANLPTQGTSFTNDELQYKVKFVFGVKPIDFRGVGKEVVAG